MTHLQFTNEKWHTYFNTKPEKDTVHYLYSFILESFQRGLLQWKFNIFSWNVWICVVRSWVISMELNTMRDDIVCRRSHQVHQKQVSLMTFNVIYDL